MSGFSAVVTTGIYCRPGCSARPNPGNVRHFDLAAAAEAAGFRACLRCRPYRTNPPQDRVASETVCRAIRLVVDGGLGSASEDAVAARMGVSARHLRRLFHEQVGVTPLQLARSSRAHFARRLLDDTDLSVTDIAFASGFGSLRQFNRTVGEIFRATPRELRARRRAADRLVADGGLLLRLNFEGPLDWDAMIGTLAPNGRLHVVGAVLDAYDPIAGRYSLEVSSPGAERPLRTDAEWQAAVGRRVHVRLRSGDAELIVEGSLRQVDEASAEIEARDRNRRRLTAVSRADVIAARIVVDI